MGEARPLVPANSSNDFDRLEVTAHISVSVVDSLDAETMVPLSSLAK